MSRTLKLGGLRSATFLVENMRLPIEEGLGSLDIVRDAVDQAWSERKAVAVIGPKGMGKTIAIQRVQGEFDAYQKALQAEDAKYRPRKLVVIRSSRSDDELEVYARIWKAVVGNEPKLRVRGRTISIDTLRDKLVEHLLNGDVGVLAFDEAELLSDEGLDVIRDLISEAEQTSKSRMAGDEYEAAGVGVVLLAAAEMMPRLTEWEETGHRLVRIVELEGLDSATVADLYRAFLPGIEEHVVDVGTAAWTDWVRQEVTWGKPVPVRFVENHTRNYVRRMAEADPTLERREDIPFDEEIFLFTLDENPTSRRPRGRPAPES